MRTLLHYCWECKLVQPRIEDCMEVPLKIKNRSSHLGTAETNPTRNHEVVHSLPGRAQWVGDLALP